MENNEFGTPDARDGTAEGEKMTKEGALYGIRLDEGMTKLYPRPLGSVKITPQQQKQEFDVMKDDEGHLTQFFTDNKMSVENMVQYLKKMNK